MYKVLCDNCFSVPLHVCFCVPEKSRVLLSYSEETSEVACLADAFPNGKLKSESLPQAQDSTATNNDTGSSKRQSDEGGFTATINPKKTVDSSSNAYALGSEVASATGGERAFAVLDGDLSAEFPTEVITLESVRNWTE